MKEKANKPKYLNKKNILAVISITIFIICIAIIINVISAKKKGVPPSFFSYSLSYVPTKSMDPVIGEKSFILIKKGDIADAKLQDIVVYIAQKGDMKGQYIVHRIIDGNINNGYIVKGDYNYIADEELVTPENFYGYYVTNLPFLNFLVIFQSNTIVFPIAIMIFMFVIIFQTINIFITYKREKFKKEQTPEAFNEEEYRKLIYEEEKKKLETKE